MAPIIASKSAATQSQYIAHSAPVIRSGRDLRHKRNAASSASGDTNKNAVPALLACCSRCGRKVAEVVAVARAEAAWNDEGLTKTPEGGGLASDLIDHLAPVTERLRQEPAMLLHQQGMN